MEILSYCFIDENSNVISSKYEELNLLPASNMKLITGYSLYSILGKDHNMKTLFDLDGNTLHISDDPTPLLTFEELYNISQNLNGNKKVTKIKFDDIFDDRYYADGWSIDDTNFCFSQKIEPYTVNEGCICKNYSSAARPFHSPHDNNLFPYMDHKELFSNFLIDNINNINSTSDHVIYRNNIKNILRHMEVFSCNFASEVMFKYLSYVKNGKGTFNESARIIKNFIGNFYGKNDIYISDGSGLSRLNLINTYFLSNFISKINKKDKEFLDLLPCSRKSNGTLKNRFGNIKNYNIIAKTGTLTHCSLLSGVIEEKNISFSIAINNSNLDENERETKIDKLLSNKISEL